MSNVLAMTSENAAAGHTLAACGMSSSRINVGKMTVKPETKYSVKNCDIVMLKTKDTSRQRVVKMRGRSRPRRSIRSCNDSSIAAVHARASWSSGERLLGASGWVFEAEALRVRLLRGRDDAHDALLKLRQGILRRGVYGRHTLVLNDCSRTEICG